jgi:hypothetical protein
VSIATLLEISGGEIRANQARRQYRSSQWCGGCSDYGLGFAPGMGEARKQQAKAST